MACIPESFTDQIDTEHKDKSPDDHDGNISDGGCPCDHNNRSKTCEKKSSEACASANPIKENCVYINQIIRDSTWEENLSISRDSFKSIQTEKAS
jgi:hypothetical protein